LGAARASWLLHDHPYRSDHDIERWLIADLLLALAMIIRISGASVTVADDGLVEFRRDSRVMAVYLLASGRGARGRPAMEAAIESRRSRYRSRPVPVRGAIVGGTSYTWNTVVAPPQDVVRGD